MDRQHRKGLELFVLPLPQKSHIRRLFKGFRLERQDSMSEEVAFAADAGLRTNASCKCKPVKGGSNTAIPLMGFVFRTFSGSFPQLGFLNKSAPKKKLEAELRPGTNASKLRVRPRDKPRQIPDLEDHLLLFMLNRLDTNSCSFSKRGTDASSYGCNEVSETSGTSEDALDTQFFYAGGFLHACPIEISKVAQMLCVRKKKPGLRKRNTLGFACLQGEPVLLAPDGVHPEVISEGVKVEAPQNLPSGEPLRIPFVPLHGLSLTTLMERIPAIKFVQQHQAFPDKERLTSVQDFFRYTESEGRRVFQDLDRDKDGQITLGDLKLAMEKMRLPSVYAKKFLHKTQSHWLAKSFGWPEFSSFIQEKEPMMIRLFNSLGVSNSGTVQRTNVKDLLRNAGFPATEDNACAMMKFLGANTEGSLKYGQFRKFMLLVPTEQLISDPWSVWFKAATSGPETSRSDLLESMLNHCTLFSRGLVHRFETAKATVVLPDVRNFEGVSNLLKLGHCLSRKQFTMQGADVSDLNNGVTEVTELQLLGSFKSNIPGPVMQRHYENEVSQQSSFRKKEHNCSQQACPEVADD